MRLTARRLDASKLKAGGLLATRLDAGEPDVCSVVAKRRGGKRLGACRLHTRTSDATILNASRPDANSLDATSLEHAGCNCCFCCQYHHVCAYCHETGCKYMPRDWMHARATRLHASRCSEA